jgi:hypothetical protein
LAQGEWVMMIKMTSKSLLWFGVGLLSMNLVVVRAADLQALGAEAAQIDVRVAKGQGDAVSRELTQKFQGITGSPKNAQSVVRGLRDGRAINMDVGGGKQVAIHPTQRPLSYGAVLRALTLASESLRSKGVIGVAAPKALEDALVAFLGGGNTAIGANAGNNPQISKPTPRVAAEGTSGTVVVNPPPPSSPEPKIGVAPFKGTQIEKGCVPPPCISIGGATPNDKSIEERALALKNTAPAIANERQAVTTLKDVQEANVATKDALAIKDLNAVREIKELNRAREISRPNQGR